jgi:hypothetical protein
MENKYLTRKDLLSRPNWDLTRIQGFQHDQVKKSETGRGRPSYLYLQSRVEAFERGESIPSELQEAGKPVKCPIAETVKKVFNTPMGPIEGLPQSLVDAINKEKSKSIHSTVFNEGPKRVSVVPPGIVEAIKAHAPKHSPLVFPPTPKGERPRIKLVVVDAEGRESLVQTPRVEA